MIKLLLAAGMSIVASASIIVFPVHAQDEAPSIGKMTPRRLISLARQGRFSEQGVPGYSRLGSAIRSGKVDGEKLVASAVAQKRLPPSALQDSNFINAVNHHLKAGGCGSN